LIIIIVLANALIKFHMITLIQLIITVHNGIQLINQLIIYCILQCKQTK